MRGPTETPELDASRFVWVWRERGRERAPGNPCPFAASSSFPSLPFPEESAFFGGMSGRQSRQSVVPRAVAAPRRSFILGMEEGGSGNSLPLGSWKTLRHGDDEDVARRCCTLRIAFGKACADRTLLNVPPEFLPLRCHAGLSTFTESSFPFVGEMAVSDNLIINRSK